MLKGILSFIKCIVKYIKKLNRAALYNNGMIALTAKNIHFQNL